MGHVRVYTISDAMARYHRMRGKSVLHPIGWDAFGLPAENAALERGVDPAEWTQRNIASMRRQLQRLGMSFDWHREVNTSHPDYFKWTQWIFTEMWRAGLVYQGDGEVNWDPVDGTVLANEQVAPDGTSWRSGAVVQKVALRQWYVGITKFAQQLVDDLGALPEWPRAVRLMQERWIGPSAGANITFHVAGHAECPTAALTAFTTRPETLAGVQFIAIAGSHPLVAWAAQAGLGPDPQALRAAAGVPAGEAPDDEHPADGAVDTGVVVTHPLTGLPLPVFYAPYVVGDYGSGVVMGVPAHDTRDAAFAAAMDIPSVPVFDGATDGAPCHTGHGSMLPMPGVYPADLPVAGLHSTAAAEAVVGYGAERGWAEPTTRYRLRDWLVSRQRYWGAPVPMVHCDSCGPQPVPVQDLPVPLPAMSLAEVAAIPRHDPSTASPLAHAAEEWRNTTCPSCGGPAVRDTDTLDTFVDSSWYWHRYTDPRASEAPCDPSVAGRCSPVDFYVGGIEHATLHLLYSRFIHKVMVQQGIVAPQEEAAHAAEPFRKLLTQGMVLGKVAREAESGQLVPLPADGAATPPGVTVAWEKMSKSKGNGVAPESVQQEHGADVCRLYTLFKAPPEKELEWDDATLVGQRRWLDRMWGQLHSWVASTGTKAAPAPDADASLSRATHAAIAGVSEAFETTHAFNVAVAELMKLSNAITAAQGEGASPGAVEEALRALVLCLAPMAPHFAAEAWQTLAQHGSCPASAHAGDISSPGAVHGQSWPQADPAALVVSSVPLVVQVMGEKRTLVDVPSELVQANDVAAVHDLVLSALQEQGHIVEGTIAQEGPLAGLDMAAVTRTVVVLKGKAPILNFVVPKPKKA